VWIEVEQDGERIRNGGPVCSGLLLVLGEDPTRSLVDLAMQQRDTNLGTVLGDVRIAGADVTRFECYSAPFHIELDDALRDILAGSWDERDPRP
jgi:hypothetical protein